MYLTFITKQKWRIMREVNFNSIRVRLEQNSSVYSSLSSTKTFYPRLPVPLLMVNLSYSLNRIIQKLVYHFSVVEMTPGFMLNGFFQIRIDLSGKRSFVRGKS